MQYIYTLLNFHAVTVTCQATCIIIKIIVSLLDMEEIHTKFWNHWKQQKEQKALRDPLISHQLRDLCKRHLEKKRLVDYLSPEFRHEFRVLIKRVYDVDHLKDIAKLFQTFLQFAMNLLLFPYRKEYYIIRAYTQLYKTVIERRISEPKKLFDLLNYVYEEQEQLYRITTVPKQKQLEVRVVEFFLVVIESETCLLIFERVSSMGFSLTDVLYCRREFSGNDDDCCDWIQSNCKLFPANSLDIREKNRKGFSTKGFQDHDNFEEKGNELKGNRIQYGEQNVIAIDDNKPIPPSNGYEGNGYLALKNYNDKRNFSKTESFSKDIDGTLSPVKSIKIVEITRVSRKPVKSDSDLMTDSVEVDVGPFSQSATENSAIPRSKLEEFQDYVCQITPSNLTEKGEREKITQKLIAKHSQLRNDDRVT